MSKVIEFLSNMYTICPFKRFTGIPCPGCGMTRAFVSILGGDFSAALHYNALSIPLFLTIVICFVWKIIDKIKSDNSFSRFEDLLASKKLWVYVPLFIIVICNWILNIVHRI